MICEYKQRKNKIFKACIYLSENNKAKSNVQAIFTIFKLMLK